MSGEARQLVEPERSHCSMPKSATRPKPERKPKQKRKLRFQRLEPGPAYRNPLTLPYILGSTLLFMPIMFAPLFLPVVNTFPTWVPVAVVLGYLALQTTLAMRSALHLHWFVGPDTVHSVFATEGASRSYTYANRDIVSLEPWGPFVIVRRASGEWHVWPRWLRAKWTTYRWELLGGSLQLR
jgi:hypothetical protein